MMPNERTNPPEEDSYYYRELIGLEVCTRAGESVGPVTDILPGTANDNFIVRGAAGNEILIPFIEDVVLSVDLASKTIVIDPIDGLLDLNEKKK